jgi:hypothetical protein
MYRQRTPRILRATRRPAPTPPKDLAMKTSDDPIAPHPNRRSLILHRHALLNDPEVVDFLNNAVEFAYDTLAEKFITANEPALLLELVRVTGNSALVLLARDEDDDMVPLPDGLFEYLLQHIDQAACVRHLAVHSAVLSSACCTLLQTALAHPACALTGLMFSNCTFADAHVQFPLQAPTVRTLSWTDTGIAAALPPMDQMLSALAGWVQLENLSLSTYQNALNFAAITQVLQHNPKGTTLAVHSAIAPALPGDPAHQPHHDPAMLMTPLMHDQLALKQLTLIVGDGQHRLFQQYLLQHLSQCLMTNTTLELLNVPGIQMCTRASLGPLSDSLNANHSLISLTPLAPFGNEVPPPVRRNRRQRYWFSHDFVLGAAEAFLQLVALPPDLGARLALQVAPTPAERAYCGAMMALLCKATHQSAVKLRSAGFREAALIYIRTNDRMRCLELLTALLQHPQLDMLPADKQKVIAHARQSNRLNFLPSGYAH